MFGGDRAQVQRYCEEIASIIQSFLPGCQVGDSVSLTSGNAHIKRFFTPGRAKDPERPGPPDQVHPGAGGSGLRPVDELELGPAHVLPPPPLGRHGLAGAAPGGHREEVGQEPAARQGDATHAVLHQLHPDHARHLLPPVTRHAARLLHLDRPSHRGGRLSLSRRGQRHVPAQYQRPEGDSESVLSV